MRANSRRHGAFQPDQTVPLIGASGRAFLGIATRTEYSDWGGVARSLPGRRSAGESELELTPQLFGQGSFQPLAHVLRKRKGLSVAVDFDRLAARIYNDATTLTAIEVH